ncbi:MAG: hypothetical protein KGZ96_05705 [Clostridia bacterium]|nr:hypothetical protein [Clostridia bacterium]
MNERTTINVDDYRQKMGPNMKRIFSAVAGIVLIVILAISSVYMVDADSVGVVWTLGKITDETQPGIHLKIPLVQRVDNVPVKQVFRREIGF